MDIKLKNYNKTINKIFLTILVCITISPILLGLSIKLINNNDILYEKSRVYDQYVQNLMKGVAYNDENGNIRDDAIAEEIDKIHYQYEHDLHVAQNDYEEYPNERELKNRYDEANANFYKSYDEYKKDAIENINERLLKKNVITNPVNLEYYIEFKNGQVVTNINGNSKSELINQTQNKLKDYMMFLDIYNNSPKQIYTTNGMKYRFDDLISSKSLDLKLNNVIIRIPNSLKEGDEIYNVTQKNNLSNVIGYGALLLLLLDIFILSIYILNLIKEKNISFENTSILKLYNKLPTEIKILIFIVMLNTLLGLYNMITHWGDDLIENLIAHIIDQITYSHNLSIFCIQLFSLFIFTNMIGYLVLCDIYELYSNKSRYEIKQYIYENSVLCVAYNKFNNIFSNKSTNKKISYILIIFVLYLISIVWSIFLLSSRSTFLFYLVHNEWPYRLPPFLFICPLIINVFGTVLIIKYVTAFFIDINKIKTTTDNIVNGTYSNKLKIKNSSILKELADNIMNIEDGLDNAITNAVKSERMKSELITNVSHDLKTPLTSIINYVDLLDKDNISEEKKKEYLGILKERSERLKVLIEDLFEASKASSGNLEMHMENLDPVALLRQTLGEFQDRITNSNLYFIKNVPDYKLTIYADGRRTFRVFQNLISNILKYSLNGTRVYIDIVDEDDFVSITFKNISKYPLNFTEDEILERFKRGDSSRTTDGSGLGLAIAKSLVEIQKGIFKLKLDGDLFKVEILLKKEIF